MSFVRTDEFSKRVKLKLLQGLVSHELTTYLSVFDLFLTQWSYYQMDVNQITLKYKTL